MSVALLAITLLMGGRARGPIDFNAPGIPLSQALDQLGKQMGATLKPAVEIQNDIVAMSFHGVDAQSVLDRIARSECGVWIQDGPAWWLKVNEPSVNAFKARMLQVRVKAIDACLQAMDKASAKIVGSKFFPDQVRVTTAMPPMGEGLPTSVIRLIGLGDLASVPYLKRTVFSSAANMKQVQLSDSATAALAKLATDASDPDTKTTIQKIDVAATNYGNEIMIEASGYSPKGDSVWSGSASIELDPKVLLQMGRGDPAQTPTKKASPEDQAPITVSPEAKQFFTAMASLRSMMMDNSKGPSAIPDSVKALAKSPTTFDPLRPVAELFIGLGEARKESVAVVLSDRYDPSFDGTLTAGSVSDFLNGLDDVQIDEGAEGMVSEPKDVDGFRDGQVDRKALQTFLSSIVGKAEFSFDDLVNYADLSTEDLGSVSEELAILAPDFLMSSAMQDLNYVRVYSSLSDEQKQTLNSGKSAPFAILSGKTGALIDKMLYGPNHNIYMDVPNTKPKEWFEDLDPNTVGMSLGPVATGIYSEPTEVAPNGLPAGGYISGVLSTTPVYHIQTESKSGFLAQELGKVALPGGSLAAFLAMSDGALGQDIPLPKIKGVTVGSRKGMQMKLFVSAREYMSGSIHEDAFAENGPVYTVDQLPKELSDLVAKVKAEFKKSQADGAEQPGPP